MCETAVRTASLTPAGAKAQLERLGMPPNETV